MRMRAQCLVAPAVDLRDVVALQAQDVRAVEVAARNRGLVVEGVRTWGMRGTLHLFHPADVGWVVGLLGPHFVAVGARRRAQLGLDDELCARALGDLFRRYLEAYGPATVEDFAAWSGLRLRDVRSISVEGLWEADFGFVVEGTEPVEPSGVVKLLGHFDTYLLGYRDRSLALPPADAPKIQTGGGFLTPHVVLDGHVVGTWKRDGGELVITAFSPERGGEVRRLLGEDTR